MKEVGAVGDTEGFVDVVVGDEDADAFLSEAEDDILDFFDGDGVDPGEGLVQKEKLGFSREGAGYFCASALAARELNAKAFSHVGQAEFRKELFYAFLDGFFGKVSPQFQDGAEVIFHAHAAKDRGFLR